MPGRISTIPADIAELLQREHGVVGVTSARAAGVHESRLRRLTDGDLLTRLAPGCYASSDALAGSPSWECHRLRARAFSLFCGRGVFLTGWSAVATWADLPTIGRPPAKPKAVRSKAGHSGRRTPYGDVHLAHLPPGQTWITAGVSLMGRGWSVAEVARTSPLPHALVVADAALRTGADLHTAVRHMRSWAGVSRARWVAEHADPLAETPIETLGRFTCIEFNLPMPVPNAWVGPDGPRYRVDGLWPHHWAAFEGDGAVKYDNRPDASAIVAQQTEREWVLRRSGVDFARYGWELALQRRAELAGRFAALLRDNPPRERPIRWWKHVPGRGPVEPEPADWPAPSPSSIVLPAGWNV